jgi:hypothetical protein
VGFSIQDIPANQDSRIRGSPERALLWEIAQIVTAALQIDSSLAGISFAKRRPEKRLPSIKHGLRVVSV